MRIANNSLIEDPVSMDASFILMPLFLGSIIDYSIQLVFTGAPMGSFKLQCSNDPAPNMTMPQVIVQYENVINWTDVKDSEQVISEAGDHLWNVQDCGYQWVRVVYTNTLGTGSLVDARFNIKGLR